MITEWARRWNIPDAAVLELRSYLTSAPPAPNDDECITEVDVQRKLCIQASMEGGALWRNNIGVAWNEQGQPVRFGLANDSAQMNRNIKSSDLIGIKPMRIQPRHVGGIVGVFHSVEVKAPGWRFTGTGREKAQLKWLELVISMGGIGKFATSTEEHLVLGD